VSLSVQVPRNFRENIVKMLEKRKKIKERISITGKKGCLSVESNIPIHYCPCEGVLLYSSI